MGRRRRPTPIRRRCACAEAVAVLFRQPNCGQETPPGPMAPVGTPPEERIVSAPADCGGVAGAGFALICDENQRQRNQARHGHRAPGRAVGGGQVPCGQARQGRRLQPGRTEEPDQRHQAQRALPLVRNGRACPPRTEGLPVPLRAGRQPGVHGYRKLRAARTAEGFRRRPRRLPAGRHDGDGRAATRNGRSASRCPTR